MAQKLIIVSGIPGTGKSTIASAIGLELGIPVYAKDWLEGSLLNSGIGDEIKATGRLGYAGYALLTTLAQRQLALGQSAILDSVATPIRLRSQWRSMANASGASFIVIECICSDEHLHRNRIQGRQRNIPGWHELRWEDVTTIRDRYPDWDCERLILDAVSPLPRNVRQAVQYVG